MNLGQVFDLMNFDPTSIEDSESNNQLADKNIAPIALDDDETVASLSARQVAAR